MWKKVRRPQEEKSRYIKRLKKCWIYKENQDMKKLVSTDFSAENWLILGKKWSMMIATADKYGCRTLPMRNWHEKIGASIFCKICRTLPMRNWHHHHFLLFIIFFTSSRTLPMRNWHLRILYNCLVSSSDITYEELTRANMFKVSPFSSLSDITYEELTPIACEKTVCIVSNNC